MWENAKVGRYERIVLKMYLTTRKIDDQCKFDAWRGHPKLVLWDNPEQWGEKGGGKGLQDRGTYVHPWLIHVNVWQKPA